MDIQPQRMVFLGYGKFWRSDQIVGLMPIDDKRGPGKRTDVYVEGRTEPIVASRTEEAILADMSAGARVNRHDSTLRRVMSRVANAARRASRPST